MKKKTFHSTIFSSGDSPKIKIKSADVSNIFKIEAILSFLDAFGGVLGEICRRGVV